MKDQKEGKEQSRPTKHAGVSTGPAGPMYRSRQISAFCRKKKEKKMRRTRLKCWKMKKSQLIECFLKIIKSNKTDKDQNSSDL